MKTFSEYFAINKPKFDFVIRIANCPENQLIKKQIETGLVSYVVETIGDFRRLPIKEHSEFPALGACEVMIFNVSIKYPVVSDQVRQRLAEYLKISPSTIFVRTLLEEKNFEPVIAPKKHMDGSVLNNPVLDADSGQNLVGDKRIDTIKKEFDTRKFSFADDSYNKKGK